MSEPDPKATATETPPAGDVKPPAADAKPPETPPPAAPPAAVPEKPPASTILTPGPEGDKKDAKPPATEPAPAEGDKKGEKPDQPKPEDVKYELTLPEDSALKPDAVERVTAFAKAEGLTPKQAQATLETLSKERQAWLGEMDSTLASERQEWVKQIEGHKEYGGAALAKSSELARRAFAKFAPPEFQTWARDTGLGDNPWLFETFYRIGQAMREDTLVVPGVQAPAREKTAQEILFPIEELTAQGRRGTGNE